MSSSIIFCALVQYIVHTCPETRKIDLNPYWCLLRMSYVKSTLVKFTELLNTTSYMSKSKIKQ